MTPPDTRETVIQPWERNDRFTRMIEWAEFFARCVLMVFSGSAAEYYANSLRQDHARLKDGRATYWFNPNAR